MQFSVLMPIYEKENPKYLKQAIESILNQTLKPNQIVIMKDGIITKELEKVLEEYKDEIEVYGYPERKGVGQALKEGIKYCRYEYIARMDADDIAVKNRFELQIKVLKEENNIDILGGYIQEYDETMNKKIAIRKVPLEDKKIKEYIKKRCPFNHSTVIMKKNKLIQCGNYRDIPLEDYDLWIRMVKHNLNMKNIDSVLVNYRTSNDMYKRRNGIKYAKNVLDIEKELLQNGMINKLQYYKNSMLRIIVALIPVQLKKVVYRKIIRNM